MVSVSTADHVLMLRNKPPYGAVRLRSVCMTTRVYGTTVRQLLAAIGGHAWVKTLEVAGALESVALVAEVVDLAVTRQLEALYLYDCHMPPTAGLLFPRLLRGAALTALCVWNGRQNDELLFDVESAAQLAAALQSNATLKVLTLGRVDLWREPAGATAVLNALVGHASICELRLWGNPVPPAQRLAAGAALGALVAANAPALHQLLVQGCALGDAGLGPMAAALRVNTHLRELDCSENRMTEAFVRDELLPSVRANQGLRELHTSDFEFLLGLLEAAQVVHDRAP